MKLAIIGSSPVALEAALRFHLHGAAFTWFNSAEVNDEVLLSHYLKAADYTSELGCALLNEYGKSFVSSSNFDLNQWKENYFNHLTDILRSQHKIRPHRVVSITKRYLAPGEQISGKSRFHDLFRVIFLVEPQEFIKEQEATNPETFERLSQEFMDSLQNDIEMYEDFDLVLDFRKATSVSSLSITGRALGETRISSEYLMYGVEALKAASLINEVAGDVREIALVGSSPMAAEVIINLKDWLKDLRNRLFIVTTEENPFEKFFAEADEKAAVQLKSLFEESTTEFQSEINEFHQRLRAWQELDDFIQAKKPKPAEPIPRLVFFSGHNATAVDQLIDKRRLFLTLEKPDFREGRLHSENNLLDLKTIGVDRILVANPPERPALFIKIDQQEKGFFELTPTLLMMKDSWSRDLAKLKGIEDEIFNMFSPADSI
jgi:hypothetical protein